MASPSTRTRSESAGPTPRTTANTRTTDQTTSRKPGPTKSTLAEPKEKYSPVSHSDQDETKARTRPPILAILAVRSYARPPNRPSLAILLKLIKWSGMPLISGAPALRPCSPALHSKVLNIGLERTLAKIWHDVKLKVSECSDHVSHHVNQPTHARHAQT